jgi:hypothetical protein
MINETPAGKQQLKARALLFVGVFRLAQHADGRDRMSASAPVAFPPKRFRLIEELVTLTRREEFSYRGWASPLV